MRNRAESQVPPARVAASGEHAPAREARRDEPPPHRPTLRVVRTGVRTRPHLRRRLPYRHILNVRVDATSYADAVSRVMDWASRRESRYVCVTPVNNVIEAQDDPGFMEVTNGADLVTPDGMPIVWSLRWMGIKSATRVRGLDLVSALCDEASSQGIPVGFYGGRPEALDAMIVEVQRRYPQLDIAYRWSPPFRPLSLDEEAGVAAEINRSGARILFVGLGAPKQELWMASRRGTVQAVMIGVGGAFDILAGRRNDAPEWMQTMGLEWAARLAQEPKRLWKRYLLGNPRFMVQFGRQMAKERPWGDGGRWRIPPV